MKHIMRPLALLAACCAMLLGCQGRNEPVKPVASLTLPAA